MGQAIGRALRKIFEMKRPRLPATVASVPTDATGKPLNHVLVTVAGQTSIPAAVLPGMTLYPGDPVTIEGWGGAATTRYSVVGYQAGTRPDSGALEIVEPTTIGNLPVSPGDLVWGNPFEAFFHMDYDRGQIVGRTGAGIGLVLDAAGRVIVGNPDGLHQLQTATGIEWRNGETVLASLDGESRTIYGFERLGRRHGPAIEWGEVTDEGTGETRFAVRVLGANGVPGIALLSGTDSAPQDFQAIIGPDGADQLKYAAGSVDLTGGITATRGKVGGWTLSASAITGGNGSMTLGATGWLDANGQAGIDGTHATWRIWAGAARAGIASAPFRVDKDGNVYATSIKLLQAGHSSNGRVVEGIAASTGGAAIGVYGETASSFDVAGGVTGYGGATGVFGSGSSNGVYGYVTSGVGVRGKGPTGVVADGTVTSLQLVGAKMNANGQNIEGVAKLYLGGTTCYLEMSGNDIYWYNGSTSVKLN